jgi:galactokinase
MALKAAIKKTLTDKFILCFGQQPSHIIQTASKIDLLGNYTSLHGGNALSVTTDLYLYAAMKVQPAQAIKIFSSGFPTITIAYNDLNIRPEEMKTSVALVKGLLAQFIPKVSQPIGIQIFIQSFIPQHFGISSSSAYLLTLLHALYVTHHIKPESALAQAQLVQFIETTYLQKRITLLDPLVIALGGMCYVEFQKEKDPVIDILDIDDKTYQFLLLDVKSSLGQVHLLEKQIKDQMNVIAQHYQANRLIEINQLQYQHDLVDLTRMYGSKTINKVLYFFQENQRTKLAYLGLSKQDALPLFVHMQQSLIAAQSLLENILIPGDVEQRLEKTIHYLNKYFPTMHFRVHGSGFAGPILCMVHASEYPVIYKKLVRQFHQQSIHPITLVKKGISIYKL